MLLISAEASAVVRQVLRVVLVFLWLPSAVFAAEQFRCGQWVVSQDVSIAELLKKCGEPTRKTISSDDTWVRTGDGRMLRGPVRTTEVWTYDRGSRQFPMIVTIIDGNIENMVSQRQ